VSASEREREREREQESKREGVLVREQIHPGFRNHVLVPEIGNQDQDEGIVLWGSGVE
jgi:hypothetical protein